MKSGTKARKIPADMIAFLLVMLIPAYASALEPIDGVPHKSITEILDDLTKWLIGFGISLCILLLVWAGLNYAASTGDEEKIKKSKKMTTYAIFGLLVIGLSYALIRLVFQIIS